MTPKPTFTTFTLFQYPPGSRWWPFMQMGVAPPQLAKVPGLRFFKLMGSGQGLVFSLKPDWLRYALLATWDSESDANTFFAHSSLFNTFRQKAREIWTINMYPITAHGKWDGANPFIPLATNDFSHSPIVVLTRASIRWKSLRRFWQNAAPSATDLENAEGLIFSCGVGELPFVRQATISVWENTASMKAFAYGSGEHKAVIRRKQQEEWYSEELFARFLPRSSEGSYAGSNPLAGVLNGPCPEVGRDD